ncbi:MAG: 3-deoxy-D-manno-octulosonate 8-phosphate phosphatase [Muribaculaceae bacterium]|nr:3-deoxy-D-manno-octulosonate 8-phosphate phosphatase [Muribaculaceae bacterium]
MSGINYNLKLIKGIALDVDGVLSPSTIPVDDNGNPMRMANVKDGYALQLAVKYGYKIAIITGGKVESVRLRYNSLGIKDVFLGCNHKIGVFENWLNENRLSPPEVAYYGDDIPDLKCMRLAGLACAPYDACHEARATAQYISRFNGGYGCVRDLLEQILRANNQWLADETAYGW